MDEEALLKAMEHDDSYHVVRLLANRPSGRTELVQGEGPDLLVRKRIPLDIANEEAWRTLAGLEYPLLPKVRDIYLMPDVLVVVTDYVEGSTLADLLAAVGPRPANEAASYVCDLCEAVRVLHAYGIVHRDIAPGNVVVAGGRAHLIDLGNARVYVEGARHDTIRLGTWGFAAPEQYGFAQTDARSDIYGLGSLLGYLLTGTQPGAEGFDEALADERRVPRAMANVVLKARAFEPSARYQSAAELEEALKRILGQIARPTWSRINSSAQPAMADVMDAVNMVRGEVADQGVRFFEEIRKDGRRRAREGVRVNGPLNWDDLSMYTRAKATVVFFVCAIMGLGFLNAGFSTSRYDSPTDKVYLPLFGTIGTVCFILIARETYRYHTRRGVYGKPERFGLLWKAIFKRVGVSLALMVAAAVLVVWLEHIGAI